MCTREVAEKARRPSPNKSTRKLLSQENETTGAPLGSFVQVHRPQQVPHKTLQKRAELGYATTKGRPYAAGLSQTRKMSRQVDYSVRPPGQASSVGTSQSVHVDIIQNFGDPDVLLKTKPKSTAGGQSFKSKHVKVRRQPLARRSTNTIKVGQSIHVKNWRKTEPDTAVEFERMEDHSMPALKVLDADEENVSVENAKSGKLNQDPVTRGAATFDDVVAFWKTKGYV